MRAKLCLRPIVALPCTRPGTTLSLLTASHSPLHLLLQPHFLIDSPFSRYYHLTATFVCLLTVSIVALFQDGEGRLEQGEFLAAEGRTAASAQYQEERGHNPKGSPAQEGSEEQVRVDVHFGPLLSYLSF